MKNLISIFVVAFDSNKTPMTCDPTSWTPKLNFERMTLHLKNKKETLTYNLITDTLCAYPISGRQESDLGKTAGRMMLSGIATGVLFKGKGGGGALMDLAIRGAEKRLIAGVRLVMRDTTTVEFETNEDEFTAIIDRLNKTIPDLGDESDHAQINKTVNSLVVDGERVLTELTDSVTTTTEKYIEAKKNEEAGSTFAERNNQRNLIQNLALQLRKKEALKKAVEFRFAWQKRPPEKIKIKDILSIFLGALVLIGIVAKFVGWINQPETTSAKSQNNQTSISTSQTREAMQQPNSSTVLSVEKNTENSESAKATEQLTHDLTSKVTINNSETVTQTNIPNESRSSANNLPPQNALAVNVTSIYKVCNFDGNEDKFLALKEEANASSTRVAKMPEGTALTVLDKNGDWFQVKMATGIVGWAHSKWICETNGQSNASEKTPSTAVSKPSKSPSFNCQNASTKIEYMICNSNELSDLDGQLAATYKDALSINPDKELLKQQQNNWRKNIRDACSTESCVKSSYTKRISQLILQN